jgi:hypothetical protein
MTDNIWYRYIFKRHYNTNRLRSKVYLSDEMTEK